MSFGDVDSTDLENLFSDMKVTSFVDDLTRPLRWVASGLPSAGKTQRVVVGASYASDASIRPEQSMRAPFPVMLQNKSSR